MKLVKDSRKKSFNVIYFSPLKQEYQVLFLFSSVIVSFKQIGNKNPGKLKCLIWS